ncbi:hypothetical protein J437_LFUL013047 [Ladona fulva]|uniref:Sepiapterin reductase n=1 Tax=Ladona fulva TaxID=123851 RepID=A0A8K0P5Y3_LADFU|nr:hypothetical protein J437_LFUL013047 [Ladona fulva]
MESFTMDPWGDQSGEPTNGNSESQGKFEDNFKPFNRLPDSEEYITCLENKLKKLKSQQGKKDLVQSLSEARQSCMVRLTTEETESADLSYLDSPVDRSVILEKIAPEKQALTTGELLELSKSDELDTNFSCRKIMVPNNPFDCQRAFLVVTGASRGIGRTTAVEFSRRLPANSVCLLLARCEADLEATVAEAKAVNRQITYIRKSIDLAQPEGNELNGILMEGIGASKSSFDQAIIIHNVGSVGDVTERAANMGNFSKWQDYFSLNVFSVAVFNTEFLKIFTSSEIKNRLVINITSLCGLQPFSSMGYYCSGKAAREMYFKVLAKEEEDLVVLNYSPGPVKTDMFNEIEQNSGDPSTRKSFRDMKENKTVLTCDQTVAKLVEVVEKGSYTSGDHIDYFDRNN